MRGRLGTRTVVLLGAGLVLAGLLAYVYCREKAGPGEGAAPAAAVGPAGEAASKTLERRVVGRGMTTGNPAPGSRGDGSSEPAANQTSDTSGGGGAPAAGGARPYHFPVRPGMEEWRRFATTADMDKATQIPEGLLRGMDTPSLVETCLDYPLILDVTAFGSLQAGLDRMAKRFNGLAELLRRPDAGELLLARYRDMNPEASPGQAGARGAAGGERARFYAQFVLVELLLAQDAYLSALSSASRRELAAEALRKYEAKSAHPDRFGFLGLSPCGLVLRQVLKKEGVEATGMGQRADVDREDMPAILAAARAFAGK
ncbi:MAG: hypothetical protein HYZ53_04175 [Planctomycetes bacterium]|nr:hypothetical protein [Planctomycetota bacterium]